MPVFFYCTIEDKNIFEFNKFRGIVLLFFDIFRITCVPNFIFSLFFKRLWYTSCYTHYSLFKHFFGKFIFPVAEIALLSEGVLPIMFTSIVLPILLEFCTDTFNSYCRCAMTDRQLCFVLATQYVFRLKKKRYTLYRRKRSTVSIQVKNKF